MRPEVILACALACASAAQAGEILYANEGNRMHRIRLDGSGASTPGHDVLIERASLGEKGAPFPKDARRDVNGMICHFPDGSGRFIVGEDTSQPHPPPGWGVFSADGVQKGKLTSTYRAELGEPYGCAFDAEGRLFTTSVGNRGFGPSLGQLILWFPPFEHFPGRPGEYPDTDAASTNFCKLATDIGTAGAVAVDAEGRVYVASSSRFAIYRFSPPFPSAPDAAGGCGRRDETGAPLADRVAREVFALGLATFSGLAFAPNGNLYAASVLTGEIREYDREGRFVRMLLDPPGLLPPHASGTPQGLALGADGTLYYADLDLVWDFPGIGPGRNGSVRRIRFDAAGAPQPPEVLLDGLAFPDGLAVVQEAPPGPRQRSVMPVPPRPQ